MYVCHICGVKNTSLTPFAKHLFQHLSQLCYICFPCTDFLTSRFQKSYMTNNVFFVSEKNSFEPSEDESSERTTHLCGECHNWFPDYKDFFLHLHVHKQELYQCPTCVLSFPTNIEHIHVDKLPAFNCLRCKSTFVADPKCNIFEPLIFCNIEKLSSHEPDMRVINQLVKEFKLCFTIKNRSKENSIIANSITSTSHVKSFSKENLSNLITNSSLKANAKPVKSFNKKQVSLKIHNGGHNSKYISPEREILNSSNVAHSINSSTHDKKDSCKTCFEGNAFSDSFSMNNSLCSSTSFHSPSSCGSPEIHHCMKQHEDSSKHQIQQTVDYPAVPYKDMIECKSYANDAEGNNSLLTIRSCLSSPVKTVEVIPNKEISENSALLKKVCSKIFLNSSVSGNSSLWTNSDVLRNHETPSRNIAKSLYNQNLETDAIASTDSFLISNDTELLKKKVLKNSENNQLALIDSQSVKNFDAGHDNLYIQNSLTPVNDVQTQTIEVSGENHDIMHSSDNLILQKNSNSRLDGNGAVYLSGLKVGDTILINYNQNKEIAKNLYPFRKFQASDTDGWLSIPVELLTPLDCKQNEAVCSNNSPIHGNFSMISDQNKVIDDIYLQSISAIESRKQQDVSLNSLQCVNISASDGFQNNQHSVNLETLGSLSIGDSQPELNNSELLNNENLKSSSYSNNNAPKYHDNFQNSTKPVSISLCNRSDNLNYNISVDEKCMNNDLFDVDQNYKCSKVANIDGFPADLNNLKPLANENTQNTIYPNLMPPEHKVGGNINSETNSGCQKSVRSPGSKDYDRAELFDYEDVLIENPLLKDSKADPIHFNCLRSENNDSTKSVERGSVSIPDSTNNNSKSGTEKNHCSTKNEKANQVLNNSKKLLVGLTKLPHYVRSYRTYKIYERSQKRKLALQKKKKLKSANKIISNLGNGLLSAPLENDSLAIGNCINVHNASTLIDTETVGKESNFQLQSSCGASPTELISISHPTNLHTMENSETIENDFVSLDYLNQQPLKTPVFNSHVKEEFNICNQKFVEQAKTPIVSTSVGAETSYINNGSQLLPSYICPPDVANKYSTDLHTVEYGSVVGNYASLHRLNYQSVVTPVSLPKSCVKQQLDFYNQQSTEEIESPVIMCDNNESYRILVSDSNQTYAQSTPNSNELNSCQLSVPLTNTSELNSCHQQVASLTENSKSCDNLFESELLDIEQVPVLITDSSSSTNNTSCLEMLHMSYQVNNKSRCNLVSPHLPSTSDSFYLMSNYQNNFDAECYQKSLENMDAFCLWKTEYQLKYLKDRIKHINETLVEVESRQNVKFLEPRILLYKLPDSVYEKYLKKKPIMLTNILPIITDVHSLSSEKNGLFKI
ncbi:protein PF3D7_1417600-like [Argiope bruennichi]|uniref:protein PF3D7_1417600-like n=1 Tax=Argiope bruennichi TaxID=94029 RepID=UPI002494C814|nr:protein PF3D7_1417600-like [Argiope bruennichi]